MKQLQLIFASQFTPLFLGSALILGGIIPAQARGYDTLEPLLLANVGSMNSASRLLSTLGIVPFAESKARRDGDFVDYPPLLEDYSPLQENITPAKASPSHQNTEYSVNIYEPAKNLELGTTQSLGNIRGSKNSKFPFYKSEPAPQMFVDASLMPNTSTFTTTSELPSFNQPLAINARKKQSRITPVDFDIIIGAGASNSPSYFGSDERHYYADALFDVTFRDRFFLSTHDGIGFVPFNSALFYSNIHANWRWGRDATGDLQGMGGTNGGLELGAKLGVKTEYLNIASSFDWGISGDNQGIVAKLETGKWYDVGPVTSVRPYSFLRLADNDYMDSLFGVNASQTSTTQYSTFDPGAGLLDYGLGFDFEFEISPTLAIAGGASYSRIAEEPSKSPLVKDVGTSNQVIFNAAIQYRF